LGWDLSRRAVLLDPERFFGAQAVLIRRDAAEEVLARWFEGPPGLDLKLGWIALMKGQPIYAHFPSLVQHVGRKSVWGGHYHRAKDYRGAWRGGG
jgi:hypothetical protein